jgi:hypothetical protein
LEESLTLIRVGFKNITAMHKYDDTWKNQRKNITKVASSKASIAEFDKIGEVEAARFLLNLLRAPDRLNDHIRHEAGTVIFKVTYGYQTRPDGNDPLVDLAGEAMEYFADATVPGKWHVDILPFLQYLPDWFPGNGYKRSAKRYAAVVDRCRELPYAFTQRQMKEKRHKLSYVSQAIEASASDPYMDHVNKWSAFALCLGGADTVSRSYYMYNRVANESHRLSRPS